MSSPRDWFRIEAKGGVADVYIYEDIGGFGIAASEFVNELGKVTAKKINLHLNTVGGSVFEGVAIHSAIRSHPAHVTVQIDGLAASAGSFIAMAGDEVEIARNGMMMIHNAQGVTMGDAKIHREQADLLQKLNENIADMYARRTGTMYDEWLAAMEAETWYSAQEAVDAGLADRIIGEPEKTATNKVEEPTPTGEAAAIARLFQNIVREARQ